jgi:hypothetical protein
LISSVRRIQGPIRLSGTQVVRDLLAMEREAVEKREAVTKDTDRPDLVIVSLSDPISAFCIATP